MTEHELEVSDAISAPSVLLLGGVEVHSGGHVAILGAVKHRAVLASLALDAGRVVSVDRILDCVWGENLPPTVLTSLQVHISQLRKTLAKVGMPNVIETIAPGYRLVLARDQVDVHRFARLAGEARAAAQHGAFEESATKARDALALWRGDPLADLPAVAFAEEFATRMTLERTNVAELAIDAEMAAGAHGELVAELEALIVANPYRESLWERLALCLYRSGRQADALARLSDLRRLLLDDLGLDPSAPITALESAILTQDPTLATLPSALLRVQDRDPSISNLPRPSSTFLGREREVAEIAGRIRQGARMMTLTGPGGTGKTRLALEVASALVDDFAGGVGWVPLAALRDHNLVTETIGQTIGAKAAITAHIADRELLLLLDNLEQVIDCAPELAELVADCPNLTLLITSRELLRVQGEVEYPVPPLGGDEAASLFCDRAQVEPSPDAAELCARLDNLPLAVELAAARTKALSPGQILQRLSERLDLLRGGRDADPRQKTLRATIEWSHDLLTREERTTLRRLSVFAGGCTVESAEAVCDTALDTLHSLVEKSLLNFSAERFSMLDTIRHYASEQLIESDELERIGDLHASHYAGLATQLAEPARDREREALTVIRNEHDNLRAALDFALERDDVFRASNLLGGLWFFWLISGQGREAAAWARRYLRSDRDKVSPLDRFQGDDAVSEILRLTGDAATAAALKRGLLDTAHSYPDAVINGVTLAHSKAGTLSDLAWMELGVRSIPAAREYALAALAIRRQFGEPGGVAHALFPVAAVEFYDGNYAQALELFQDAADLYGSHAESFEARLWMARCQVVLGHNDQARAHVRELLPLVDDLSDRMIDALALRVVGIIAEVSGDAAACALLNGATNRILQAIDIQVFVEQDDEIHRPYLQRAADTLGQQAFDAACQRGWELSREEILAIATSYI